MLLKSLRRFRRDESGLALVELALGLPLVFLVFAITVEGGRLFWSYQTVIEGVRDATRYAGRAVPSDLCSSGAALSSHISNATLQDIVERNANATGVFPPMITVTNVTASRRCVGTSGDYRVSPAPVVQVRATLQVQFPFSGFARFATGAPLQAITTSVTDESRVFGS